MAKEKVPEGWEKRDEGYFYRTIEDGNGSASVVTEDDGYIWWEIFYSSDDEDLGFVEFEARSSKKEEYSTAEDACEDVDQRIIDLLSVI